MDIKTSPNSAQVDPNLAKATDWGDTMGSGRVMLPSHRLRRAHALRRSHAFQMVATIPFALAVVGGGPVCGSDPMGPAVQTSEATRQCGSLLAPWGWVAPGPEAIHRLSFLGGSAWGALWLKSLAQGDSKPTGRAKQPKIGAWASELNDQLCCDARRLRRAMSAQFRKLL